MITGPHRRELNIDGIDAFGLVPIVSRLKQGGNTLGVINQLVAIDEKRITHKPLLPDTESDFILVTAANNTTVNHKLDCHQLCHKP